VLEKEIPSKLLLQFDCTQEYGPDQYFGHPDVQVITQNMLHYREAGSSPSSRFGYRFQITKVGHPHVAVITYPHDKRRFMCVMDGTCYDLNSGIVTGQVLPVTGKFEDLDIIFWPRWTDCSITILTYSKGEPAAAAMVRIYELEQLPALHSKNALFSIPQNERRWIGIQYEDPCGCTASEGAHDHFEWTDRIINYAKFTGQNLLIYPLAWYHGPLYPSNTEVADITEIYVADDRKQYVRWSTHPNDWYQQMLTRFDQEGLSFIGSLTLLRLSSLMKKMNTNIKAIVKGAETINNVMENNRVRGGTGDWTGIHNAINYEQIVAALPKSESVRGFHMPKGSKPAYGEFNDWHNRGGPIFNPLHPIVQSAIFAFIQEIGERYKNYSAFKGISINMYASTICWFGNLRIGYDDYTMTLFTQETGIKLPGRVHSKHRFGQRAKYLLKRHKETWIQWRCKKIKTLFCSIRDILEDIRADYRLIITLWDETVLFPIYGTIGAAHQYGSRMSNYDLYREAGIDIDLYQNEPGIFLDIGVGCTRDRGGHPPDATAGMNIKPEHSSMYRDFDFLDEEKNLHIANLQSSGAYNFNCWVESWGKYMWFHPDPTDPNLEKVKFMNGAPVDGYIGCNSLYPPDGFWWDSQERIVPTFLGGDHYMEPFAHALAEYDVCRFSSGGLFLDSAHSFYHRRFAAAFTALPASKFKTVGEKTDPIAVRTLVHNNQCYIYAINRNYYEVDLHIQFQNQDPFIITDIIDQKTDSITPETGLHYKLNPYELRVWVAPSFCVSQSFNFQIDAEIVASLENRAKDIIQHLTTITHLERKLPGIRMMIHKMEACLINHSYSLLERCFTSYIVRKSYEFKNNNRV
jgi:hypothetical protein